MLSISIHNASFYSHHGLFTEEKIIGGEFEVNLTVTYLPEQSVIEKIEETINYATLYEIVKKRMAKATPLLETIAMELHQEIVHLFPLVKHITVIIEKKNPPISNFIGSTMVNFSKDY
jgi:7,8-dihydroneopterin aldolase/epimerase/oxygenase